MSIWEDAAFWNRVKLIATHPVNGRRCNTKRFDAPLLVDGRMSRISFLRCADEYDSMFIIPSKMVFKADMYSIAFTDYSINPLVTSFTYRIRKSELLIDKRTTKEEVEELLTILRLTM